MFVAIIGGPGSGKGTQSRILAASTGLVHVSTGDILRAEIEAGTELGRIAGDLIDRGQYVPDDLASAILAPHLTEAGAILDGYPRTDVQCEMLDGLLAAVGSRLDVVVHLAVDEETLIGRLGGRAAAAVRDGGVARADDDPSVLRTRLERYRSLTSPVIGVYRERGILRDVDGSLPVEDVAREIAAIVGLEPSIGRDAALD